MQIVVDRGKIPSPCYFCEEHTLESCARVEKAPRLLGCTQRPSSEDAFLDFRLLVCSQCGLIQTDAPSDEKMYAELHSEALGSIWEAHHRAFASWIQSTSSEIQELTVLEIGASCQPIARKISEKFKKIIYIDPIHTPPFDLHENEEYLSGFFPSVAPASSVDLVIASHVLEHIPATKQFLHAISKSLNPKGRFFVSIPQFKQWFEASYFNAISAEHVNYPFAEQMEQLALRAGFSIETQLYREHSLFACFQQSDKPVSQRASVSVEENRKILDTWVSAFQKKVFFSDEMLYKSNRAFFLAGASHLAQYFLLCNPRIAHQVTAVIDNSHKKWGHRLYGTDLMTRSFDILQSYEAPIVFIPPSPYTKEMREQVLRINPSSEVIL